MKHDTYKPKTWAETVLIDRKIQQSIPKWPTFVSQIKDENKTLVYYALGLLDEKKSAEFKQYIKDKPNYSKRVKDIKNEIIHFNSIDEYLEKSNRDFENSFEKFYNGLFNSR